MSDAEVIPGSASMMAAEQVTLTREMCAHTHDFAEIILLTSGEGDHLTDAGTHRLRPGTLIVLGPHSWHSYANTAQLMFTNLYLSGEALELLASTPTLLGGLGTLHHQLCTPGAVSVRRLPDADAQKLQQTLATIAIAPQESVLAQASSLLDVLDHLVTLCHDDTAIPATPLGHEHALAAGSLLRHSPRVSHAISLFHERIEYPWSLREMGIRLSISPSQLVRAFRAELGEAPMTHLQRLRAERMAYLLRTTDLTIAAAGRAVGWQDPSYASRRFSAHWGLSPLAYRARTPGV